MKQWVGALVLGLAASGTAQAAAVEEQPIALGSGSDAVQGSLLLPHADRQVPVVLLIAGSGPTDRDGNSRGAPGRNDSLKQLANALAEAGFASVRYDKRGIGASAAAAPREADLRFETYVDDAAAWVRRLSADPRFSGVAIVGHSEGSLIGMRAAQMAPARAFVSIAGPSDSAPQVLRRQLLGKLPPELAARNEEILASLEAGKPIGDVPQPLAGLYRESVQLYLISWFKYTPSDELKRLTVPAAVFQGDTDIQVQVADAQRLVQARPAAELHVIAGMNHVLKLVPADQSKQIASYIDPSLPIAPDLVDQLTRFLRSTMP
jgi:pimeloyl-ACP methyl ester carboxylesterase